MIMTNSQAWDHAMGMIKVDGLEPKEDFKKYRWKEPVDAWMAYDAPAKISERKEANYEYGRIDSKNRVFIIGRLQHDHDAGGPTDGKTIRCFKKSQRKICSDKSHVDG